MAADRAEHEVRGVPQSRRFALEHRRPEEARRDPQRFGEGMDGGLVRLEVDREHPGHRPGCEPGLVQTTPGERGHFIRRHVPFATDADREPPRAVHESVRRAAGTRIVHPDRKLARIVDGQAALGQPPDPGGCAHPRSSQQSGDEGLAMLRIHERPVLGRLVEPDAEAAVAGGGDRGGCAGGGGDAPGEIDPAAVPPEKGHRERSVVGDGDDRRLRPFVVEGRRHRPHEDPGRADPGDRPPRLEQRAQVPCGLREDHVRVVNPPAQPVHFRVTEGGGDPAREPVAARGESDHRDALAQLHANPRRCTRIIEK